MTTTYKPLEVIENRNGDIAGIEYHNATPDYLFELSKDASIDHLVRSFGAAGLVRFCLDVPLSHRNKAHLEATTWASRHLLNVREDFGINAAGPMPHFFSHRKPNVVTGTIDEMTVMGIGSNRPAPFYEVIESVVPDADEALVIALGHGGIISSADSHIAGVGTDFYPVRYSLRKRGDTQPILSRAEITHLNDLSKERSVILIDDDCSHMMTTLCTATEFFARTFGKTVYGATPAHAKNLGSFSPAVITSDKQMLIGPDYPGYWGGDKIG